MGIIIRNQRDADHYIKSHGDPLLDMSDMPDEVETMTEHDDRFDSYMKELDDMAGQFASNTDTFHVFITNLLFSQILKPNVFAKDVKNDKRREPL